MDLSKRLFLLFNGSRFYHPIRLVLEIFFGASPEINEQRQKRQAYRENSGGFKEKSRPQDRLCLCVEVPVFT